MLFVINIVHFMFNLQCMTTKKSVSPGLKKDKSLFWSQELHSFRKKS